MNLRALVRFIKTLFRPVSGFRIVPTEEQKQEIGEELRKQKMRGDLAGPYEY